MDNKSDLLLVLLVLLVADVESSSPLDITRGSAISTSSQNQTTSYWLSPSKHFGFGFLPSSSSDHHQHYIIGIWLIRTCDKTLLWSLNNSTSPPLSGTDLSILFDQNGFFKLQVNAGDENGMKYTRLLFGNMVRSSASYASMHDNGNFVIYNSNSQVLWQSFDYPTDTILAGQTLESGYSLISSNSKHHWFSYAYLMIMQQDGNLVVYDTLSGEQRRYIWGSRTNKRSGHSAALKLDSYGNLHLVDWNNLVINNLYKRQEEQSNGTLLYRLTLEADGILRLYSDRVGCEDSKQSVVILWRSSRPREPFWLLHLVLDPLVLIGGLALSALFVAAIRKQRTQQENQDVL